MFLDFTDKGPAPSQKLVELRLLLQQGKEKQLIAGKACGQFQELDS
jgi:hypothetical protein